MKLRSLAGIAVAALAAGGELRAEDTPETTRPDWLGAVTSKRYDGTSDDLVTGGLGVSAMITPAEAPGYADPLNPTAAEIRRAALFSEGTDGEGFGRQWGANVDPETGETLPDDGKIAGEERLAFADPGDGSENVGMLLQIPDGFDAAAAPCILAVPSTGSAPLWRNDIAGFGYWGLRKGCAVVYTDKGLGNGVHDLATDTVNLIDGTRALADEAGTRANFRADLSDEARENLLQDYPHRIAFKHAHSKQNPEATWGRDVLRAIRFAFAELNDTHALGEPFTRENTLVIVSGNSNGGGAALYAAEADEENWIDGVVAAQPQVQLQPNDQVTVARGGVERTGTGRPLLDYFTVAILHQPCAALATPDAPWVDRIEFAAERCASLKEKGLLEADTLEAQAQESLQRLRDYGWEPESDLLHASHYVIAPDATAVKYASDHGRFGVEDRLCGLSFAALDEEGRPTEVPAELLATIYPQASGGAPVGSIDVVNDRDPTGPRRNALSVSPSTGRTDYNMDGALCLRELAVGKSENARRVQAGISEFLADADLGGKPALIVHGRADARVPVGFTSRPYLGLNSLVEGDESALSYIELTNVQHFGTDWEGYDTRFVPINIYHLRALEAMWDHLRNGEPLPPSQVVRVTPRGGEPGAAPVLTEEHVPGLQFEPGEDRIEAEAGRVVVPD